MNIVLSNQRTSREKKKDTQAADNYEDEKKDTVPQLAKKPSPNRVISVKKEASRPKPKKALVLKQQDNFKPEPKQKLRHFQIPRNIHPFTAIELALTRSRQQLDIARILKIYRMKEQEKQNQMPPVSSRHQKFSIDRKIVQDDIRTKIKAMNKNISPVLLAQFEDGVTGMQYI